MAEKNKEGEGEKAKKPAAPRAKDAKPAKKKGEGEPKKKSEKAGDAGPDDSGPPPAPRVQVLYKTDVKTRIRAKFDLKNVHEVPRLRKISVNMGVGKSIENRKRLDAAVEDLSAITGQKAKICNARRSEANFKLRKGMPIGCKVDLRGARMYEFFDRLVSIAIPRIRDFRGIPRKSFDGRGNFSMGLAEQIVFPEVPLDKVEFTQGMDITMVISGGSDEMSLELLENLGMPFKRN